MHHWFEWIHGQQAALWWVAAASALMFLASLVLIPMVVARIPTDYFAHARRPRSKWTDHHPAIRAIVFIGKNTLGCLLIAAGIAMIVLPGQGVLSIVAGILLLSFPGKYRLTRWLVGRRPVLRSINWLRRRAGRQPLVVRSDAPRAGEGRRMGSGRDQGGSTRFWGHHR